MPPLDAPLLMSPPPTTPTAGVRPPDNPANPGAPLAPFRAVLVPPGAHLLHRGAVEDVDLAQTSERIHPDLPPVPVWGFGRHGSVSSPGPLLEARAGQRAVVRWRNRLPGSLYPRDPGRPVPQLPFATAVLPDPEGDTDSVQNELGAQGAPPGTVDGVPIGWTSVHLHGAHVRADSDGWPDNMTAAGEEQLSDYANTYDNLDLGLDKVGAMLWYHDHAMNGTRFSVYAGLAGGYLVRDPREEQLGLPTSADEGEIVLIVQDRNIDVVDGRARLLHKTTDDTAESFGPLTLVNGRLWPRLPVRPEVYRLRLLNGSNARAYRLHLVQVDVGPDGGPEVTVHADRVLVIGTDGGLLRRAAPLGDDGALTLAPAERVDVLVNLAGLPDGSRLHLVNSAQAPFGGDPPPPLADLWASGDRPGRNPYPWVLRLDVDCLAPSPGAAPELFDRLSGPAAPELNPAFRRLVHQLTQNPPAGSPQELALEDHAHHTVLLAESNPPGHLLLQEIVEDPAGTISLQLPGDQSPKTYQVAGWMPDDPARSDTRVAFYDRTWLRPVLGQWQLWKFVNTTGDTHPMHIHQSVFQPLGDRADRLRFADGNGDNVYDPMTRTTSTPLVPETDPELPGRAYEAHEVGGWKDVVRIDPGNVVKVAIRFDLPGRYVYHCHVLEHEDTEMMRPFVVTIHPMDDGEPMHHHGG